MSSKNLYQFLEDLVHDLSRDIKFREHIADREEHMFSVSAQRLATQTYKEFKHRGIEPNSTQRKQIEKATKKAFKAIKIKAERSITRHDKTYGFTRHRKTKFTSTSLTVVYRKTTGTSGSIFEKIKRTYNQAISEYYMSLLGIMMDQGEKFRADNAGDFFHAGHAQDSGVFEFRVSKAVSEALNDIGDYSLAQWVEGSKKKVAYTLRAIMSKDASRMSIIVESKHENAEDAILVNKKRKMFIDAANTAMDEITKGRGFYYFEGSDSPIKRKRKEAIKAAVTPFKKIKGIKVVTEDIKFDESRGKAKLDIEQKITKRRTPLRDPVTGRFISRDQAEKLSKSPVQLMTLINAKLPETVMKNMGLPALVNRTGTFARSARVDTAVTSAKGFTTLGFSYDTEPYGVFQMGRGIPPWATPERDPRDLIRKSIREIAVQLIQTKFAVRSLV